MGRPAFLQVRARPIPILPIAQEWPPPRACGSNMWGSLPSMLGGGAESPHQVEVYPCTACQSGGSSNDHGRLVPIGRDPVCGSRGDLLVPIGRHPNGCRRKDATARTRRDFRRDRAASAPEWSGGKLRSGELLPASARNLSRNVEPHVLWCGRSVCQQHNEWFAGLVASPRAFPREAGHAHLSSLECVLAAAFRNG
jgi:hypothetical protein